MSSDLSSKLSEAALDLLNMDLWEETSRIRKNRNKRHRITFSDAFYLGILRAVLRIRGKCSLAQLATQVTRH